MPSTDRLPDHVKRFLGEPNYATIATIDPDGTPRQAVSWFRLEPDDRILVNSRPPRRWPANLERDRRIALAIIDRTDGNRWVGLRGEVEEIVDDVDRSREDIVALAHRYADGNPSPASVAAFREQPRVSFLVRVDEIHDHLEDPSS